jgi:hypothetical protein
MINSNENRLKVNNRTRKAAWLKRYGDRWTDMEELYVHDHREQTDQQIALILGRTLLGVRAKRVAMGITRMKVVKVLPTPMKFQVCMLSKRERITVCRSSLEKGADDNLVLTVFHSVSPIPSTIAIWMVFREAGESLETFNLWREKAVSV